MVPLLSSMSWFTFSVRVMRASSAASRESGALSASAATERNVATRKANRTEDDARMG